MSVHSGVKSVLAVVVLAATTVLTTATPGAAAVHTERAGVTAGDCPFPKTVCLFDQTGYAGVRFTVAATGPGGACVSLVDHGFGGGRIRSVLNSGAGSAALFAGDDCVGGPYQVAGNSGIADLSSFQADSVWVP
ncbi:peptidase inhibitor family I36 protein [Polymorphospora sp. NPDC050346]|uniref:peptidase inhibitor family I36 protein n=1 Tax=Polymorphospora sp. NPDC050346 TaxID=3155780 RepID=UPI003406ABC5